jgi:hypothetical protein
MQFTKQDKLHLDNLVRILSKAKIELEGVEVLAAADAMRWLASLQLAVNSELEKQKPQPAIKPVEPPIKQEKAVKKAKKD